MKISLMTALASAALCCMHGAAGAASMYKCIDATGKVSYADHPCTPATKEAWASRLGTGRLEPKQVSRPEELARVTGTPATGTAQERSSAENARIEALRLEEMTRILGQHAAPTACAKADAAGVCP